MEILSIGEKIRRARIYKGLKLKDICGESVSISKMSCIENDKIDAEEWILDIVAQKLDIDSDYLKQDVEAQLILNLNNECVNCKENEKEKNINYNLSIAKEYGYYDIAFKLSHLLFAFYLEKNNCDMCFKTVPDYFTMFINSKDEKNRLVYFFDIGEYFSLIREYDQAANYYKNVRLELLSIDPDQYDMLGEATFKEALCYYFTKEYNKAYNISNTMIKYKDYVKDGYVIARIYGLIGLLCVKLGFENYIGYEEESYSLCANNLEYKANISYFFAKAMVETKFEDKVYEHIEESIKLHPKENKKKYYEFMFGIVEVLIKIKKYDEALKYCDSILNYSIQMNINNFIEKAYYLKAILMDKLDNMNMCEMYMNLSFDMVLKINDKEMINKRYLDMAKMYYKLKNSKEAIKYFNLILQSEKKL